MSSLSAFKLAARSTVEERDKQHSPLTIPFEEEGGTIRELVAHYPGDQQLTAFIATLEGDDSAETAGLLFQVLKRSFTEEDYRYLRNKYASEEITQDMLQELLAAMVEHWSTFPTQQSGASPSSPPTTGTSSTVQQPSVVPNF